jgi:hypothetical protein
LMGKPRDPEADAGVLEIRGSVMGIGDFQALVRHAVEVPLFGRKCRVISLEGPIRGKEAIGREKNLLVAKELRAIAAKRQGKEPPLPWTDPV